MERNTASHIIVLYLKKKKKKHVACAKLWAPYTLRPPLSRYQSMQMLFGVG